ncbi:DUF3105 domain-containing protein [Hoyosella sp. YIM 151337]|uniref:DUF3105 domain-containing protein n=1 Tax=Hoyosella sp. YIM 151337 TaxID=2992742 RepID=UPI0022355501|nr:DUF3105 domain-containing protein [Hoyosella sp. YIM 151337]MCW4355165.1 DUF3105 domain-containing protein [Hoyosella sp. YIM 151337]
MASGGSNKDAAKSAKAIKAARKGAGGASSRSKLARGGMNIPWLTLGAVLSVIALIVIIAINLWPRYQDTVEAERWAPTAEEPDPSQNIEGIIAVDGLSNVHINPDQRVAYDHTPPLGGPHDAAWATCNGIVYEDAIRVENAVHSLEHGAVWITYEPELASEADIDQLRSRVQGQSYLFMSPYPGQETPISLQAWGRQLQLDSADDERITHFIGALRLNPYTSPEVGASCATIPGSFDPESPLLFDPEPPGPDAVQMDGSGAPQDADTMEDVLSELNGEVFPELPDETEGEPPAPEEGDQ